MDEGGHVELLELVVGLGLQELAEHDDPAVRAGRAQVAHKRHEPHARQVGGDEDEVRLLVRRDLQGGFAPLHVGDDALARRYYPRVLAYLTRQVGDGERARDLTQDAFYRAFRGLRQLRTPRLFAAWPYRIVATTVADAYRRQQRAPPTLSLERLPTPPATEPPDLTRLLVGQALAALEPGDRTILVMDGVWGLSEREIATALGISRDAAHQRLRRAKQRFRARYPGGDV